MYSYQVLRLRTRRARHGLALLSSGLSEDSVTESRYLCPGIYTTSHPQPCTITSHPCPARSLCSILPSSSAIPPPGGCLSALLSAHHIISVPPYHSPTTATSAIAPSRAPTTALPPLQLPSAKVASSGSTVWCVQRTYTQSRRQ